ncbi:MAG: 50S ribosomal protein L3 [Deltaproteobacteria bacterium]|nr:50S ribosomal protein L3 [Deltaproteobacteria bacterium]MBW1955701.1 50S ribosomal protein L3 [Deltaproteobacteria bacterium]MBW2041395.1 50S ribosomal protein L3 [Deltaproteobacteria bacterium]MBW2133069.1 50S ribosomal protein L3 [Deltaproteobacteria bacterium]
MSKGVLGKKLGMTSLFTSEGILVPITVIQAGPCVVTQIKTEAKDGYNAVQVGFGPKKDAKVNRPEKGHFKKSGGQGFSHLKEFRVEDPDAYTLGQEIRLDLFRVGERVTVTGTTKGRGFSGTIKRHGFHRGPKTHGSHNERPPGSIGCSAWPSRVVKGKKLPGRFGKELRTLHNLEVVDIRIEEHLLLLKGAVPGPTSGLVEIHKRHAG